MEVLPRKGYTIDDLANAMTEDEYRKAKEFYKFLMTITKCSNGVLTIERKKLIDIAAAYMECTPVEAYNILTKMKGYGWIKTMDTHFIIVNIEKKI
ncbi:hypothetical protein WIW89_00205 [Stygiolobus sp. CP850M]|uniref:hypothetical protein n=1 Tax=Stygiolobus sp. CP850M TaxID=3133134 RepID=UPI00307D7407